MSWRAFHAAVRLAETAIRIDIGAVVHITSNPQARWCVSGQAADVRRARPIMRRAGLRLVSTEIGCEDLPGEIFDRYRG